MDTEPNPLGEMAENDIAAEYERRRLDRLTDRQLVELVAHVVGMPKAEVLGDRFSFVLHAPLELMARAALLPHVEPERRHLARLRIVAIAAAYQASGPPIGPPAPATYESLTDA